MRFTLSATGKCAPTFWNYTKQTNFVKLSVCGEFALVLSDGKILYQLTAECHIHRFVDNHSVCTILRDIWKYSHLHTFYTQQTSRYSTEFIRHINFELKFTQFSFVWTNFASESIWHSFGLLPKNRYILCIELIHSNLIVSIN